MREWFRNIQKIVDEIDRCIKSQDDEALVLTQLSERFGYSEFYVSRKFKEVSGMQFKDYLRCRKLAFALKDIRDTQDGTFGKSKALFPVRTVKRFADCLTVSRVD